MTSAQNYERRWRWAVNGRIYIIMYQSYGPMMTVVSINILITAHINLSVCDVISKTDPNPIEDWSKKKVKEKRVPVLYSITAAAILTHIVFFRSHFHFPQNWHSKDMNGIESIVGRHLSEFTHKKL